MNFFQRSEIMAVNAGNILALIPENLQGLTKIEIKIYSNTDEKLKPCQSVYVSTGIFFDAFHSDKFHIFFKGFENSCGLHIMNKLFVPSSTEELKVIVTNYAPEYQFIRTGMPLGRLFIQPNN